MTLTAQQVFDTTITHLITQGVPANDALNGCRYRGPNHTSCAVGCHITDEEYQPSMESNGVMELIQHNLLPERLIGHAKLLTLLQYALHDTTMVEEGCFGSSCVNKATCIARQYNLNTFALIGKTQWT